MPKFHRGGRRKAPFAGRNERENHVGNNSDIVDSKKSEKSLLSSPKEKSISSRLRHRHSYPLAAVGKEEASEIVTNGNEVLTPNHKENGGKKRGRKSLLDGKNENGKSDSFDYDKESASELACDESSNSSEPHRNSDSNATRRRRGDPGSSTRGRKRRQNDIDRSECIPIANGIGSPIKMMAKAKSEANDHSQNMSPNGEEPRSSRGSKLHFKFVTVVKESHRQPIFAVQIHPVYCEKDIIFATAGSNHISVYRCQDGGNVNLIQSYVDSNAEEIFYTCAWTVENNSSLLAAAGALGAIRIICPKRRKAIKHFCGHGGAINELQFHPVDSNLLISASKDYTCRLWNIVTDACVAIFGGVDGHRDEVLSVDFNTNGSMMVTCGMDHCLMLWNINHPHVQETIHKSYQFDNSRVVK